MVAIGGAISSALAMTLFVVMIGYGTVAARVAQLGVTAGGFGRRDLRWCGE
jgi:hypothetical protein